VTGTFSDYGNDLVCSGNCENYRHQPESIS
jgi:hypothetical protein